MWQFISRWGATNKVILCKHRQTSFIQEKQSSLFHFDSDSDVTHWNFAPLKILHLMLLPQGPLYTTPWVEHHFSSYLCARISMAQEFSVSFVKWIEQTPFGTKCCTSFYVLTIMAFLLTCLVYPDSPLSDQFLNEQQCPGGRGLTTVLLNWELQPH